MVGELHAGEPLRIMTFNAQLLAAPGTSVNLPRFRSDAARQAHCERVAALIETLRPDILNLCEVNCRETVDYLVGILHERGLTEYCGYHVENADTYTGLDVALIARTPLDEPDGQPLRMFYSPVGDDTWRQPYLAPDDGGAIHERTTGISRNVVYYFTVSGHKLGLLGLHLRSHPGNTASDAQRTAEAKVAQRIVRNEIVARGYTPIVLGDLNDYDPDVPDRNESLSTKTTVLADIENYDPATPEPELVNAASRIVRRVDRYTSTWDRNENGAVDRDDALTMIDHILVYRDLMPAVRRVFISHLTDLNLSDHSPVIVDLDLN